MCSAVAWMWSASSLVLSHCLSCKGAHAFSALFEGEIFGDGVQSGVQTERN